MSIEKNDEEIKNYRQKVKHLQYEHQNNIAELKAEAMITLQNAQKDHTEQENELLRDKKDLKTKLREQELANQDEIKALKLVSILLLEFNRSVVLSIITATK